ncbi:unnamed protein product [Ectocarpus sp. CCAP 1310/34]|nr:unnamed protein product [Ectocarpus sp. CCAP 1310/34]
MDQQTTKKGSCLPFDAACATCQLPMMIHSASLVPIVQVLGWDSTGAVEFNDVVGSNNTAGGNGGCFYGSGRGILNAGTFMRSYEGINGAVAFAGSYISVEGGKLTTHRAVGSGGFLYAAAGANVTIKGGAMSNNVADRRAGAVHFSGEFLDMGGSKVTIEGGTQMVIRLALGLLHLCCKSVQHFQWMWCVATLLWFHDAQLMTKYTLRPHIYFTRVLPLPARFFGGFIFLDEEASLSCEDSSYDLICNQAPQGAAAYLTSSTVEVANFQNHTVFDTEASGSYVVYVTETSVIASGVSFQSGVSLQEDSSNSAIQLEGGATLIAEECVFGGWTGDSVIQNANQTEGSLVLDSCDFSDTTATMVVTLVGDLTIEDAAVVNNSLVLVDRALRCESLGICGSGECMDSALGVLCECLEDDDGESLIIHQCVHHAACVGATQIPSAQDYCGQGYQGPCAPATPATLGGYQVKIAHCGRIVVRSRDSAVDNPGGGVSCRGSQCRGLRRSLSTRSVLFDCDSSSHKAGSSGKSPGRDTLADSVAPALKVASEVEGRGGEGAVSRKGVTTVPISEVDVSEMKSEASSDTDSEDDHAPPMARGVGVPQHHCRGFSPCLRPVAMVLVLTYSITKRRARAGSAGSLRRRAAWSRHVAAGLLRSFSVFIATSNMAFKTFAYDDEAVEGESCLRADYSIQCHTDKHGWYKVYAESLNPRVKTGAVINPRADGSTARITYKPKYSEDLEEKLEKRRRNPDLIPSITFPPQFLPMFAPDPEIYYYEVVECGRRILLTGVLIFISPNTAAQVSAACMFAFGSLLCFELLGPHLEPVDSWLYRLVSCGNEGRLRNSTVAILGASKSQAFYTRSSDLFKRCPLLVLACFELVPTHLQGCLCIFLSNFLALLIKVDSRADGNHDVVGAIMIGINVFLIMAVLLASWFSMQQTMDEYVVAAGTLLAFEQLSVHAASRLRALQAPTPRRPPLRPSVVPACLVRADT